MHTKSHLDDMYYKCLYFNTKVHISLLSEKDITHNKSEHEYSKRKIKDNPICKKKIKLDLDKTVIDEEIKMKSKDLKVLFFRESETNELKINSKNKINNRSSSININKDTVEIHNTFEESTTKKQIEYLSDSLVSKIGRPYSQTLPDESTSEQLKSRFSNIEPKLSGDVRKLLNISNCSSGSTQKTKEEFSLREIERLYLKYFEKSVQDTTVILANILNLISLIDKLYKTRLCESRVKSKVEIIRDRCHANTMYARHKNVLRAKFTSGLTYILKNFISEEFTRAFRMFFVGLMTVFNGPEQATLENRRTFKELVYLLKRSLKLSDMQSSKAYSVLRSDTFHADCIGLRRIIEECRRSNHGIINRKALFFAPPSNSKKYFKAVIDAVTFDTNEYLVTLIDVAAFNFRLNSKFVEPRKLYSLPSARKSIRDKTSVKPVRLSATKCIREKTTVERGPKSIKYHGNP